MTEITLNPDILPTKEEWILVCKMIKQQCKLTDEEIREIFYTSPYLKKGETITYADFYFAKKILQKASEQ